MIIAGATIYAMVLSSKRLEFEQMRTTYIALAQSIGSMLTGSDFYASIPVFETSFGYKDIGTIMINSTGNVITRLNCRVLESRFTGLGIAGEKYFGPFDQDTRIVGDVRLIPSVYSVVEEGGTLLRLDTCRLYVTVETRYDISNSSQPNYFITITFVNLNTTIMQEGRAGDTVIYAYIEGEPLQYTWTGDGARLTITFPDGTIRSIRDFYPGFPGGTIRLDVRVYNLRVEVRM